MASKVKVFHPNSQHDKWVCNISGDVIYHVNVVREQIDKVSTITEGMTIEWIQEVPIKVLCFIWRANLKGILTACALQKRGIIIIAINYSYCELEVEDPDHILINCSMARKV